VGGQRIEIITERLDCFDLDGPSKGSGRRKGEIRPGGGVLSSRNAVPNALPGSAIWTCWIKSIFQHRSALHKRRLSLERRRCGHARYAITKRHYRLPNAFQRVALVLFALVLFALVLFALVLVI